MMGSYMGNGVSQMIMAAPYNMPQVNNFYNQGSNYGQGYNQNYGQPQAQATYAQPQPQMPQGYYGQGAIQNISYSAPSVNNYAAPQPAPIYMEPQVSSTYNYPPSQGTGYNYNANVPIVYVYNQVQAPRYNNHIDNSQTPTYQNVPAPKPYPPSKFDDQGMFMSPDFIKGFMMASMGMGMLQSQLGNVSSPDRSYDSKDAYCPPGMKKPSYGVKKHHHPTNYGQNPYGEVGTLPILKNTPDFQYDTHKFWGQMPSVPETLNPGTTDLDQASIEEMSQFFFFILATASEGFAPEAPQQEQEGFPFPPELLQLIQGYMN